MLSSPIVLVVTQSPQLSSQRVHVDHRIQALGKHAWLAILVEYARVAEQLESLLVLAPQRLARLEAVDEQCLPAVAIVV